MLKLEWRKDPNLERYVATGKVTPHEFEIEIFRSQISGKWDVKAIFFTTGSSKSRYNLDSREEAVLAGMNFILKETKRSVQNGRKLFLRMNRARKILEKRLEKSKEAANGVAPKETVITAGKPQI